MLTKLKISNFRCFDELHLSNLRRINLITGRNNTGKTTLLEGLTLLAGGANTETSTGINVLRGLSSVSPDVIDTWGHLFHNRVDPIALYAELDDKAEPLEVLISMPSEGSQPAVEVAPDGVKTVRVQGLSHTQKRGSRDPVTGVSIINFRQQPGGSTSQVALVPTNMPVAQKAVFLSAHFSLAMENEAGAFGNLKKRGDQTRLDILINALRELENRLKDLEILPTPGSSGTKMCLWGKLDGVPSMLPFSLLGGGMVQLLRYLLHVLLSDSSIILIDEVENGLHYSVQQKVWRAICDAALKTGAQIFATTHSYEFIRAAVEAPNTSSADLALYRLDRGQDNKVKAVRYDSNLLKTSIENFLEVR